MPTSAPSPAPSSSDSGSDSGSGSGWLDGSTYFDLFHALAGKDSVGDQTDEDANVSDDYCMFNATETEESGCKKPRTCGACLRVTGCMVNSTGYCTSAALHYNESLDFRSAKVYTNYTLAIQMSYDYWNKTGAADTHAVQDWIFPSTTVDYCDEDSLTCHLCRLSVFPSASKPDMRFCVGATGCICTALCDSPALDQARHRATVCDPSKKPLPQSLMWVIGAGATLLLCIALFVWVWRRTSDKYEDKDNEDMCTAQQHLTGKDPRDKPTSQPSIYQTPPHPDTPVMELSLSEYPESSRRRPVME